MKTTQRECFAIVSAVLRFRPFIEGTSFTIPSDHDLRKWIGLSNAFGRLARCLTRLSKLDPDTMHRAGLMLRAADVFSRLRSIAEKGTHSHDEFSECNVESTQIASDETHSVQTCR